MLKPSSEELAQALLEAERMRDAEQDPHHVAKALLSLHERVRYFEQVYRAVEHYLRSGQAVPEHRRLVRALEEARRAESHAAGADDRDLGVT